jgi:hypothetical protein
VPIEVHHRSLVGILQANDRRLARGVLPPYNASCNAHRFDDLAEFVAPDNVINGTDRGLDVYAQSLRVVARIAEVWGNAFGVDLLHQVH